MRNLQNGGYWCLFCARCSTAYTNKTTESKAQSDSSTSITVLYTEEICTCSEIYTGQGKGNDLHGV